MKRETKLVMKRKSMLFDFPDCLINYLKNFHYRKSSKPRKMRIFDFFIMQLFVANTKKRVTDCYIFMNNQYTRHAA